MFVRGSEDGFRELDLDPASDLAILGADRRSSSTPSAASSASGTAGILRSTASPSTPKPSARSSPWA